MKRKFILRKSAPVFVALALMGGEAASRFSSSSALAQRPEFIPTVRAYSGAGLDEFQRQSMKELGLRYVQGLVDFTWDHIERGDNVWKWRAADEQMDKLAQAGLKVIGWVICPKSPGLPWDESIRRDSPEFADQYREFAYQVVKRYHAHPAWSGLVAVWGGSSDVFGEHPLQDPEVQVPLLNAAYDGIKRADPKTIVISFNLSTSLSTAAQWEDWFKRAFTLSPKFDWFGVHTYHEPVTCLDRAGAYAGVLGLANVRKFLDQHGYAHKPLWLNEGGFRQGEDLGGLPEQMHAEQVVESYIVGRTLGVNLKGWVYFEYFSKTRRFEDGADFGLMSALDQHNPPRPRQAWLALQTLIKKVRFFDYDFDTRLSGEYNRTNPPFVYRFLRRERPAAKLWVVFSPWGESKQKPVVQNVTIPIAPATQATLITMLGKQSTLHADSAGKVAVTSTSSPSYVIVEK